MIKNYLLTAFRNLLRSKVFSFIHVGGLTIGISSCLLAAIYLHEELTFDQFHKDFKNIYRVAFNNYQGEGPHATTPFPVGPALREDMEAIEAMTRVNSMDNYLVRNKETAYFEKMTLVDSGFFDVFSFRLLKGNPATALSQPNQIVITEPLARKYFGDEDPVGKMLNIGSSGRLNSIITGVVAAPPGNSQVQFDILLSIATIYKLGWTTSLWFQMPGNHTYIRLNEHSSAAKVMNLFPGFAKKYVGDQMRGPYETHYNLTLQPLQDIHLQSHMDGELPTQGNATSMYLFVTVAGIILLIACINYINLTTARYIRRSREMGVRKVAGASRLQLVGQLLGESVLLSIAAGVVAPVVVEFLLPWFNELAKTQLKISLLATPLMITVWMVLVLVPSVGAGLFPALYLARVNIVRSLKDGVGFSPTGLLLRKGLVAFQFFAATFLLTATLVVFQQMDFIRATLYQHDQQEQVVVFPISAKVAQSFETIQNQLASDPTILGVSASSSVPGFSHDSWPVTSQLDGPLIRTENFVVDSDYAGVMNYHLLAGRNFVKTSRSDTASFLINEKGVKEFGFETPEKAIGQTLYWGIDPRKEGTVIGVIKDFNFSTFREEIQPVLLQQINADWLQFASVRLRMNDFGGTLDRIRQAVSTVDPNWIVDYKFMDENFQALHQRDLVQGKLFGAFSIVAIIISCMGLLGLAIFSTSQRNKEMGIRKTLGASSSGLMIMIVKDFVILFLVAYLFSLPVSWYTINQWLDGFAYHINLSAGIYSITGALILSAVILTVGYQALKTGRINPVDVLKNE